MMPSPSDSTTTTPASRPRIVPRNHHRIRRRSSSSASFASFAVLLAASFLLRAASAYRLGDAVGVLLRTHAPSSGSATLEAYRHQLPRFGVSTRARFDVSSLSAAGSGVGGGMVMMEATRKNGKDGDEPRRMEGGGEHLRLSMSFDGGFHRIPWTDVYDPPRRGGGGGGGGRALESLIVTIVYSGGDGTIHAVHREARYRDVDESGGMGNGGGGTGAMPGSYFDVDYVWINEADVDVGGGTLVLFVAVLLASLGAIVGSCGSSCRPRRRRLASTGGAGSSRGGGDTAAAKNLSPISIISLSPTARHGRASAASSPVRPCASRG